MVENFRLYVKQQEIADKVTAAFLGKGVEARNFIVVTGETGVGKTYIAADIIKQLNKPVLIISPKHVKSHWTEILALAGITRYKIVSRFNSELINQFSLVIYDEIHEIKTKTHHFTTYLQRPENLLLGLTGSAIDKKVDEFVDMFSFYAKQRPCLLYKYTDYLSWEGTPRRKDKYDYLLKYIKPLFTVGINKEDIHEVIEDQIIINTISHPIEMDNFERAFYDFALYRANALTLSDGQKLQMLNDFLDRVPNGKKFARKKGLEYYIGESLHGDNIRKNEKLAEIIAGNHGYIVYTLCDELAKYIGQKMDNLVYVDANKEGAVEKINELLETTNVIIDINPLNTGVAFNSDNLIWYQTPISLGLNIQGIGRISRLHNSDVPKNVHYLYNKNTVQEKITKQIKKNNDTNNIMLKKVKDSDQYKHVGDIVGSFMGLPIIEI